MHEDLTVETGTIADMRQTRSTLGGDVWLVHSQDGFFAFGNWTLRSWVCFLLGYFVLFYLFFSLLDELHEHVTTV